MELIPNSTLTTKQIRSHFRLSRSDAIAVKDRSVNAEGVADGVIAYKSGEAYKQRMERRTKQGTGVGAKPRLTGWTRRGCGGKAEEEQFVPLHMNTNEPAVGLVELKASKRPAADALAAKGKFPRK